MARKKQVPVVSLQGLYSRYGEPQAYLARECPDPQYASVAVTKGSPYKKLLDKRVPRFVEAGLLTKWRQNFLDQAGKLAVGKISRCIR